MFYVGLWLTLFIGWICLLVWGMTMESRDRRRAKMSASTKSTVVTVEEDPVQPHRVATARA
jgi:hypothetical protein